MNALRKKVKQNLIIQHNVDDKLITGFITSAAAYAASYQHREIDWYDSNDMSPTTEQGVIMLASFFYESREGATAGFYADSPSGAAQVWNTVNSLLRLDRLWGV